LENESVTAYRMTAIIPALALAVTRLMFEITDAAYEHVILIWLDTRERRGALSISSKLNTEKRLSTDQ
jgi:hypothetical protein